MIDGFDWGSSGLDTSGLEGSLTVSTSAVELKVGSTAKINRVLATLFNNSSVTIYWGYTSSVTTSTGTPIYAKQFVQWSGLVNGSTIYLIAGSAGNDTRITEVSG